MYLCAANMTEAELNEYATALAEADADTRALLYLKRWKSLMKVLLTLDGYLHVFISSLISFIH